ncbi:MAG: cytochrome-c oxidase, cbb3-type subunit III [Reyranellaceae bacterium]
MADERRDPITGRMTTGHEWNGIEELDTPVPKVVLFFLAATTLFAIVYWVLMPAWPLGSTYTKGLLGIDQRAIVAKQISEASVVRAVWADRIAAADFSAIAADPVLMRHVRETGRTLFMDNCAVCHGSSGAGQPGFPDLTARARLWGGAPETIAETIRVGINSNHPDTRVSQMMSFGRDGIIEPEAVRSVVAYVRSLSNQPLGDVDRNRLSDGKQVFAANCASCHGADGRGSREFGAPDLTDDTWIYGGDANSIHVSVHYGRQGHMPHWEGRLSPMEIKLLTLYVDALSGDGR